MSELADRLRELERLVAKSTLTLSEIRPYLKVDDAAHLWVFDRLEEMHNALARGSWTPSPPPADTLQHWRLRALDAEDAIANRTDGKPEGQSE